ncbi:MAG: protein kinase domain-containing protein [Thermoanaerobaculia bacterium]
MTLPTGVRFGPYEILAPLGAGGMGEVYRARDTRLGREVAVKVLPEDLAGNPDRLRRFEQEAKAASALNHPNILTIHDVGTQDSTPYVVSELLEGSSLRERLNGSALPARKALDYGLQIARGLAAAHEMGIVHRDLKPENLFVTKDGRVKILDFGLAKLAAPRPAPPAQSDTPTIPLRTESGMVLGTVGYMAPEQVRGEAADHRSDIFAFGAVLYEMLTGRRAFRAGSGIETMTAILKDEPPGLAGGSSVLPPGSEWVLRRCLEKSREERFQSASDLAFALEAFSGFSASSGAVPAPSGGRARRSLPLAAAALLPLLAATAFLLGRGAGEKPSASFRQLTFRRGTILTARFAPDGGSVVYGAAWDGQPFGVFTARPESPESSQIPLPPADLLALSRSGELALSLDRRFVFAWMNGGTLARASLAGGTPRQVLEAVQEADWSPDGGSFAVVRRVGGKHRLELPIGKVLYETAGWLSHPRVSSDGSLIAFVDHPIYADDRGGIAVVDRGGRKRVLTPEWTSAQGLAWAPDGKEIWFTASEKGLNSSLHAVSLSGRLRDLARAPGRLTLLDASKAGRALVTRDASRVGMVGLAPGEKRERELTWLDSSSAVQLSDDGRVLLFTESGEGGGPSYGVYLRSTDGSPATRLGDGQATALSPDGKWALAIAYGARSDLRILPTGPGEPLKVPRGPIERYHWASWMPDGKRILVTGNEPGRGLRIYLQDPDTADIRAVTPEGVGWLLPPTPDGRFACSADPSGRIFLYPIEQGEPRPVPGLEPGDAPLRWADEGRTLFVRRRGGGPLRIDRLDVATGRRELWKEIVPGDPAGFAGFASVQISAGGAAYVYTYHRLLSELFLVEGLE